MWYWIGVVFFWTAAGIFIYWSRKQEKKMKEDLDKIGEDIKKTKAEIAEFERKLHVERLRKAIERSIRN